jgi:hypothetical protein
MMMTQERAFLKSREQLPAMEAYVGLMSDSLGGQMLSDVRRGHCSCHICP